MYCGSVAKGRAWSGFVWSGPVRSADLEKNKIREGPCLFEVHHSVVQIHLRERRKARARQKRDSLWEGEGRGQAGKEGAAGWSRDPPARRRRDPASCKSAASRNGRNGTVLLPCSE